MYKVVHKHLEADYNSAVEQKRALEQQTNVYT